MFDIYSCIRFCLGTLFPLRLGLVSDLLQALLERLNGLFNIRPPAVRHADTHVSEPHVLARNLLVQTTSEDDTLLHKGRQDIRGRDALGQHDSRHAVGLVLGLGSDLLEAELGNSLLDALRGLLVRVIIVLDGAGQNLRERRVQGADELGRGGREIRRLLGLVVLHDGKPVLPRSEVGSGPCLAVLEGLDGTAGSHQDGQTGGATDTLLRGSEHNVKLPVVEPDLLAADTAHAVHDDEGLGADAVDELRERLDLAEHTGGGVHVGDGKDLVLLLLERGLDLVQLRAVADGRLQLCGLHAVGLQAVGERVGEVAGVQDEGLIAGLAQVGSNLVPAQGAGAGDDEGLRRWVRRLEELTQVGEDLAEDVHEGLANVRLAGAG